MNTRLTVVACLVLSLIGAWLAGSLFQVHVSGKSGSRLLAKACGGEGEGCDKVISSRWAYFPPAAPEDSGEDESAASEQPLGDMSAAGSANIPVAALGLFYFTFMGVWFATVGRAGPPHEWMNKGVLAVCGFGCLVSLCYIIIMTTVVKAICPLCLGSHLANFGLLGLLLFSHFKLGPATSTESAAKAEAPTPSKGKQKGKGGNKTTPPKAKPQATPALGAHPSNRLGLTAVALALVLCFGLWNSIHKGGLAQTNVALAERLNELSTDSNAMEMAYFQQPTVEIEIREDDPIIQASPGTRMTVVMFSDIECKYCAAFDTFLHEQVKPMFDGHLRIVYKHFPNTQDHPNAFAAATAVEAARIQGKFWEGYHFLVERRKQLGPNTYEQMARQLGLDMEQFRADMASQAVKDRIQADIREGHRVGCTSTPTVFFNKRKLDSLTRELPGFWELRRDGLKRVRAAREQGW